MKKIEIQIPVKIGDSLYTIQEGKINTYTVTDVKIELRLSKYLNGESGIMSIILDRPLSKLRGDRYIYPSDIGDTMFLLKTDLLKNIADQL